MTDLLKEWDSNDDGRVDRKEFADGLIKMGIKATRQDFNTLFDSWDNDGGGSLDARELARALKSNDTVHSIKVLGRQAQVAIGTSADFKDLPPAR